MYRKSASRRREHALAFRVALERHRNVEYVKIVSLAPGRLLFKIAHNNMFLKARTALPRQFFLCFHQGKAYLRAF